MNFERVIPLYMEDCHARHLRIRTMQACEQELRLFAAWLQEKHGIDCIEDVKDVHIRSYISDLLNRGKYTFCINRQSEQLNHPQNRRDYQAKISSVTPCLLPVLMFIL